MSKNDEPVEGTIYRVDKFLVPDAARQEFLQRVQQTHELLRMQSGFVRDAILEQQSGPGLFNFVTMVEWTSAEIIEPVSAAVAKLHADIGFDRQEMMSRLQIKADIGTYRRLPL